MIADYGAKLEGGPFGGQRFHETDLFHTIRAAQHMRRTDPLAHASGWILGYQRVSTASWQWTGRNCWPKPIDENGKVIEA